MVVHRPLAVRRRAEGHPLVIVPATEYFLNQHGETQLHVVLTGALLAVVAGTWSTSLGLSRDGFVLTTALMLELAALSQVTTLLGLGALSGSRLWQAGLGCLVVAIMLPVGQHLGRKVQKAWFDRLVLVVLLGSATALLVEAL